MWRKLKTGVRRNGKSIAAGLVAPVLCLSLLCLSAAGIASAQPAPANTTPAPPPNSPSASPIGPPIALTLPEAVFIGLRDNLGVRSAYIQRVADKFALYVAEYKFKPLLGFAANLQRKLDQSPNGNGSRSDGYSFTPTATLNTITGAQFAFGWANTQGFAYSGGAIPTTRAATSIPTLSVVQPLLQGAGIDIATASVHQAEISEQNNILTLKSTVSSTINQIIQTYRSYAQALQQVTIAQNALQTSKDLLNVNQQLIASGRMAREDLVQSQASVAQNELSLVQARNSADTARLALLVLLALDPHSSVTTTDDSIAAQRVTIDVDRATEIALANRPDYLQALNSVASDVIALQVAKNARLWNLSVTATVGRNAAGLSLPPTIDTLPGPGAKTTGTVGLSLSFPINDPTPEQGEVQAQVALDQAKLTVESTKQQVAQQVHDAVTGIDLGWQQLILARQSRALAQRQLDVERIKLRAGRSSNFEVVTFQNQLVVSQSAELTAIIGYLNALSNLDLQLGTTLDTWKIALHP
jgi:outer membrane protein